MQTRNLSQDLAISSIGYGAMGLSEFYGKSDDQASLLLLSKLIEYGINFIDTADIYGRGHNERLIGHFLARLSPSTRDKFRISTKCGIDRSSDSTYNRSINNTPDYIIRCCNESLSRLGLECIDLFYLHRISELTPIEESMDCLKGLVKEGKIKHIGLCEVSASTLRKAHNVHSISVVQSEYSLWSRDIEHEILPVIKELDIGLVPYSPLGRGFLTGKYLNNSDFSDDDFRKNNERFLQRSIDHNVTLLNILKPIAYKHEATMGQISLAWLLAQYEKLVPIPGTKHIKYLAENAGSAKIILDKDEIELLNRSKQDFKIKGNRYSEEGMKGINA